MTNIKLVLTDLDGTVVPNMTDRVSTRNAHALQRAEAAGVRVCAVTGRPYLMASQLLVNMGAKDPCVFDGGAIVGNPLDGQVLWERLMSMNQANQVLDVLRGYAKLIDFGSGDTKLEEMAHDLQVDMHHIWAAVPTELAEQVEAELNAITGIVAHLNKQPKGVKDLTGVQITHIEADKEHGVRALLAILDIPKEQIMAVGDGNNDLPLFKHAGLKVAVGDASPKLKTAADKIVATMADDGFAEAIERFVL